MDSISRTPHLVDSKVKQARDGGLIGGYGLDVTRDIQRHLKEKMKVKGKEVFFLKKRENIAVFCYFLFQAPKLWSWDLRPPGWRRFCSRPVYPISPLWTMSRSPRSTPVSPRSPPGPWRKSICRGRKRETLTSWCRFPPWSTAGWGGEAWETDDRVSKQK